MKLPSQTYIIYYFHDDFLNFEHLPNYILFIISWWLSEFWTPASIIWKGSGVTTEKMDAFTKQIATSINNYLSWTIFRPLWLVFSWTEHIKYGKASGKHGGVVNKLHNYSWNRSELCHHLNPGIIVGIVWLVLGRTRSQLSLRDRVSTLSVEIW